MERLSWTTRWAQCNHQSSLKRKAGESESERDDGRMEAEVRERRCSVACFEDGGGPQAKECVASRRARKRVLPDSLQIDGRRPADRHFDFRSLKLILELLASRTVR